MLTFITPKHLKSIIHLSGEAIRSFLSQADAKEFKGEAHDAIIAFQAKPLNFTDDKLVSYGSNTVKAINYPIRIEVRGITKEGAAQMVAKGIWGPRRDKAARDIYQQCKKSGLGLHLKLAGSSSIEFNVDGVDKSLPIAYIQSTFDDVLKEMKYKPGKQIDARRSKTMIAADGDSTIYDGPRLGFLPTLKESPVRQALCAYLKAGGVFMLVSGNDLNRSFKRLVAALPKEVYCRVLVAANGGAELVYADSKGRAVAVSNYRRTALGSVLKRSIRQDLDMIYIGDDGSMEGNDYPAFKAVGFKRSVLVAPKFLPEYDPCLKPSHVGGLLQGTRRSIEEFLSNRLDKDGR